MGFDVLAVVAVGHSVTRQIVEEVSGGGLVDIGNAFVRRDDVADGAFGVVLALDAAIADGPRLLVVIGGDGRHRPGMSVAGDFAAVVEVVEHAELARQGRAGWE